MDITAKPEEESGTGEGIAPFSPPSSQLPRPQGALSMASRAPGAPLEVLRTPDVTILEEHARNGSSPSKVVYSRAEDFIAATLTNLSLQNYAQSEAPAQNSNNTEDIQIQETTPAKVCLPVVEASTTLAPGMSEAEYVFKALSRVPPDMRYQVIPSLVKNLTLKTYGDVRVSDCISSPIMSVRCQPDFSRSAIPDSIENAAAQVLEANFDAKTQPSTNIEGLVSTVLSLTQAFRKIEDIAAPQSEEDLGADSKKAPLTADDIVGIVGPIKFEEEKPKVWREGMIKDNKEDASKTVFMTQNLNKQYEKDDVKKSRTSFEIASAKITREVGYFSKILDRAGSDMRDTEYSLDPIRVLDARQKVKDELLKLKGDIDLFISSNLEGDIREKPAEKIVEESASCVKVEYVYPNEKKLQGKEQKIVASQDGNQVHICIDCNEEIVVAQDSNLEDELLKHTHGNDISTNAGTIVKSSIKVVDKKERKANEAKHKRAMFLNKLVPCLIDDNFVNCLPCGVNLESDNAVLADHMDVEAHVQNLNQYNARMQKELIIQNPDLFGPNKLFYLTDLHTVMNKIFVDPVSKYAYCGLCKKELPPRQQNVEEHIKSKGHDKLLLDFLEGKQPTISSNRNQVSDGAQVKIAQMLDVTEQPEIDVSQLEKLLETKARKKSPQQDSDDMEIASNSSDGKYDHIYRTPDRKHVCLICDSRNIPNQNALDAHHGGALHKKNLEASKNVRNGLNPDQQALMVQNGIAVSYGKLPLIFECLACSASYANYETMLRHLNGPHVQNLARVRSKQAVPVKKNNKGFNRVILHRNGTEFWCFKCRMTLPNIGAAYEHVKLQGHEDSVDGVKYTTATQFYCTYCMVKINGERNVGQHVMGPKHKSFANADSNPVPNKQRTNSESNSAPSFSRAQVKKQKDEKNSSYQGEQNKSNVPYQLETPKTDEGILLQRNGVLELPNGTYDCAFCGTGPVTRSEIFHHIFSFDHLTKMSKLGAR